MFAINLYKENFNFASSHFLVLKSGRREPLHGHNYRMRVRIERDDLQDDMVKDFSIVKPLIRDLCNELDHKFLLPVNNPYLTVNSTESNIEFKTVDGYFYSLPKCDILGLPVLNISSECLAQYCHGRLSAVFKDHDIAFSKLIVEVEESVGQSAEYTE